MTTSILSTEMWHDNERKQLQSDTGCKHVGDYFPTRSTSSFSIYVDVECKQIIVSRNNHDMDYEFRREMRCTEGKGPNVSTLLSSAFIRGDLNAASRGPFIPSLIGYLFSDEV